MGIALFIACDLLFLHSTLNYRNMKKLIQTARLYRINYIILIAILLIVFIMGTYLWIFDGGIARDHETWGEFGSLLAALTGLLSFIGVLMTYLQSKKQGIASEERSSFFKMFDILNSNRWHFTILSSNWRNLKEEKEELVGTEAFEYIATVCLTIYSRYFISNLPKYYKENEVREIIIPEQDFDDEIFTGNKDEFDRVIKYIYTTPEFKLLGNPDIPDWLIDELMNSIITDSCNKKQYELIIQSFHLAADEIYSIYHNQIGVYFRNAYYILDMISGFINKRNNFGAIYRAQLSKDELILLFFNSFSSMATPLTRVQYMQYDLFNNLKLKYLHFPGNGNVDRSLLETLYSVYELKYS